MEWILKEGVTIIFGTVGEDEQGKMLKNLVEEDGVHTNYQINKNYNTGMVIGLAKGDTRALIANIGAANYFDCDLFTKNVDSIQILKDSSLIYIEACFLPNRSKITDYLTNFCLQHKKTLVFNVNAAYLFDMVPREIKELSEKCSILFGNRAEFSQLAKLFSITDPDSLALTLNGFSNKIVVITDGSKPIKCVYGSQKVLEQKVQTLDPEKIVDTVSAGDAFVAGFLAAYLKNYDIETCLIWAQTAARQIIMQPGCTIPKISAKKLFQAGRQNCRAF